MNKPKDIEKPYYIDNKEFLAALVKQGIAVRRAKRLKQEKPQISDYLGNCLIKIANHLAFKSNFINYCVDDRTEALTKRGWLKYDQLKMDDAILSLDMKDDTLKWSAIKDIFINDRFDDKLFHLFNPDIDAMVSDGHNFVCGRELISVNNLRSDQHITLIGGPEKGGVTEYNDYFVELVGWCATDGATLKHVNKKVVEKTKYLTISQKEGWKAYRIKLCLSALGFSDVELVPRIDGSSLFRLPLSRSEEILKAIPDGALSYDFIISLSQQHREVLINALVSGDGTVTSGGLRKYMQTNKDRVDTFVFLCALSGIATNVKTREMSCGRMHTVTLNNKKTTPIQKINFHGSDVLGRTPAQPTFPHKGVIWCPQTEYGTFVCRRNNSIFVTGNTYRDDMILDAIENCLIYVDNFDPKKSSNPFAYFSQICYYAFIRRIQREKRQLHTKYRYIESLNLDDIILQAHDSGEYGNEYIEFLKKEVQASQQELAKDRAASLVKKTIKKRRPKYMDI